MAGLNGDQIGALRTMMQTTGWNEVFLPLIRGRAHQALEAVVVDPSERKGPMASVTDATLRARIQECDYLLTVVTKEIEVFNANQRLELEQRQRNGVEEDLVQTPPNA